MKKLRLVPLHFRPGINGAEPVDQILWAMAMDYCRENLREIPDLTRYQQTYLFIETGEQGEPLKVHGITCGRPVFDIGVIRVTGPFAKQGLALMGSRWNAYLADRGFLGEEVFVWIDDDEKPEQRCDNQEASIEAFGLKPSNRMSGRVE